jgi:putative transposase
MEQKGGGMYRRKDPLAPGEVYHVFSRSISSLEIFSRPSECARMCDTLRHYQHGKPALGLAKYIVFTRLHPAREAKPTERKGQLELVLIICYCLMPTHLHLVLKQLTEHGISEFMSLILNSYTRYFNTRHHRKGPLWEGRFKDVRVKTDDQLLHLTRYIHLNPVTAYLVGAPEEWRASSYREYLSGVKDPICTFKGLLNIDPARYRLFVEDRAGYQRRLGEIKRLLLEEPCAPQKQA